jgi:hypothetical protein
MHKNITVSFFSNELMSAQYTRWTCGNLVVIHDDTADLFLCCVNETGELLLETSSLKEALRRLTGD